MVFTMVLQHLSYPKYYSQEHTGEEIPLQRLLLHRNYPQMCQMSVILNRSSIQKVFEK